MKVEMYFSVKEMVGGELGEREIDARLIVNDSSITIQVLDIEGVPLADVYLEAADGFMDLHVFDAEGVESGVPKSTRLLELDDGKNNP